LCKKIENNKKPIFLRQIIEEFIKNDVSSINSKEQLKMSFEKWPDMVILSLKKNVSDQSRQLIQSNNISDKVIKRAIKKFLQD